MMGKIVIRDVVDCAIYYDNVAMYDCPSIMRAPKAMNSLSEKNTESESVDVQLQIPFGF